MATTFTFTATAAVAAPTVSVLTFESLYTDVGEYVYGTRSLSAAQIVVAKRLSNRAYLEFLGAHDWNFMSPQATLAVTAADQTTDLPAGFGEIIDDFTFTPDGHTNRIRPGGPEEIRQLNVLSGNSTGAPVRYAIQPKTFTAATGQRYQVLWYPVADSTRTLYYRYRVEANEMTDDDEYPLGGQAHIVTIRECCMRFAELETGKVNGPHADYYFQFALPASIRRDAAVRPKSLGYMGDSSSQAGCGIPLRNTVEHT